MRTLRKSPGLVKYSRMMLNLVQGCDGNDKMHQGMHEKRQMTMLKAWNRKTVIRNISEWKWNIDRKERILNKQWQVFEMNTASDELSMLKDVYSSQPFYRSSFEIFFGILHSIAWYILDQRQISRTLGIHEYKHYFQIY